MLHAERCERGSGREGGETKRNETKRKARRGEARQDKAGSPESVKGRENNVDMWGGSTARGFINRVGENSHDTRVALSEVYRCAAAHAA